MQQLKVEQVPCILLENQSYYVLYSTNDLVSHGLPIILLLIYHTCDPFYSLNPHNCAHLFFICITVEELSILSLCNLN